MVRTPEQLARLSAGLFDTAESKDTAPGMRLFQIFPTGQPRHNGDHAVVTDRSTAHDGELVVARLLDNRRVLARYRHDGGRMFLETLDGVPGRDERFELCAVVIGMMRKYGLPHETHAWAAHRPGNAPCPASAEVLGRGSVPDIAHAAADKAHGAAILHVDIDAFFAATEQVLNPELGGRPVIVGGWATDRSVVASASYEARALGVRVAMPLAQAARLCPDAVFLRGKFQHYQHMSEKVMALCADVAPVLEMASMDEAYLDLTGCERLYGSILAVAERLKQRVKAQTGLNVSIGIAANKMLAKIASDYAKPNGILQVWPDYGEEFLAPLPLKELPGIGRHTRAVLARYNLHTISQLARAPKDLLTKTFGSAGEALYQHARGRDTSPVHQREQPKSISRETTFEEDTADRAFLVSMIYYLTERATRRLRHLGMKARTVALKLRYSDFHTVSKSLSLRTYSRQDHEFYRLALRLLDQLHTRRVRIRLVGLKLSNLAPSHAHQRGLFGEDPSQRRDRLYTSVDRIRDRFGFSAVAVGPSIALLDRLEQDQDGFKLRTACLSQ